MAELKLGRVQIHQVIEQGIIPRGQVVHGTYDDEQEAWARHDQLLREDPALRTPGVLQVRARYVEVLEPVGSGAKEKEAAR